MFVVVLYTVTVSTIYKKKERENKRTVEARESSRALVIALGAIVTLMVLGERVSMFHYREPCVWSLYKKVTRGYRLGCVHDGGKEETVSVIQVTGS